MWGNVIKGVVVAAIAVVSYMFGDTVGEKRGEQERSKVNEENGRLRRQIISVLSQFKKECAKMESIIADIAENPPESMAALRIFLEKHNLSAEQVNRILAQVHSAGMYREAA